MDYFIRQFLLFFFCVFFSSCASSVSNNAPKNSALAHDSIRVKNKTISAGHYRTHNLSSELSTLSLTGNIVPVVPAGEFVFSVKLQKSKRAPAITFEIYAPSCSGPFEAEIQQGPVKPHAPYQYFKFPGAMSLLSEFKLNVQLLELEDKTSVYRFEFMGQTRDVPVVGKYNQVEIHARGGDVLLNSLELLTD